MSKLPNKAAILQWITDNPTQTAKRDIAKAFGIKGAKRIDLKRILKELEAEGHLTKRKKTVRDPDSLPPVSVLQVIGPDSDGDLKAKAMEWEDEGPEPEILIIPKQGDKALGAGDRILARVTKIKGAGNLYEARLIRHIGANPERILGVFRQGHEGGRILPIDKGASKEWEVPAGAAGGAKDGEFVEAELIGTKARMGLPRVQVVTRLGDPTAPKAVSLIAIHQHGIPDHFPDEVIAEADAKTPAGLEGRMDLRDFPLVTIDPSDARDHDDACYAEPDTDPANNGGHILWVAIADVAHYVTPGSELDVEARNRGNSSYFPDRVVPMLPDRLSGDLCSLHEGVSRACIAVRIVIDADGQKLSHEFLRGLMKSHASLNYTEVQQAMDGNPNEKTAPFVSPVLRSLYAAYGALKKARALRQPLELDLPERKIILDDEGKVTSVAFAERFDAHRLIEEFMVLANVCAAETLIEKKQPLLFRVHEEPSQEKLNALREIAQSAGLNMAKGQVLQTKHLNQLLRQAADTDEVELINISTLRSMTQAYYSPENFGHFGLALRNYGHFTSPIRRYADLIVHRALVTAHGWGKDGLTQNDADGLKEAGEHISQTERRSMMAERDTTDRYLAAFLSEYVGEELGGRISGVVKFGVFVKLDATGADGLVPVRSLGCEFFHFDADSSTLMGSDSGFVIGLGQRVTVKLASTTPQTGGVELEMLTIDGQALPKGGGGGHRGRGKPVRRKEKTSKIKTDKVKRKVKRQR